MTRGKLVLITNNEVLVTTEFNGDMYPDGHGADVFNRLVNVNTTTDFLTTATDFNEKNFNYPEDIVYEETKEWLAKRLDFGKDYFDLQNDGWFSDWIYIKNISEQPVEFIMADSREVIKVMPNEVRAFNFGNLPSKEDQDFLEKGVK